MQFARVAHNGPTGPAGQVGKERARRQPERLYLVARFLEGRFRLAQCGRPPVDCGFREGMGLRHADRNRPYRGFWHQLTIGGGHRRRWVDFMPQSPVASPRSRDGSARPG